MRVRISIYANGRTSWRHRIGTVSNALRAMNKPDPVESPEGTLEVVDVADDRGDDLYYDDRVLARIAYRIGCTADPGCGRAGATDPRSAHEVLPNLPRDFVKQLARRSALGDVVLGLRDSDPPLPFQNVHQALHFRDALDRRRKNELRSAAQEKQDSYGATDPVRVCSFRKHFLLLR